jgi:CHASE2 domain-containing sensor protein
MNRLVVINFGSGNLQTGFANVIVRISATEDDSHYDSYGLQHLLQFNGSLPPAPEIAEIYGNWQLLYREFCQELSFRSSRAIEIESGGVTNFSAVEFNHLAQELKISLNSWLNSESFNPIDRKLSRELGRNDRIRIVLETNDELLQRLPWHLWNFFEDYPQAEIALSVPEYEHIKPLSQPPTDKVRILAIFGNSDGLNLRADRSSLEALPDAAPCFLECPDRQQLYRHLSQPEGWDILFFAGHSRTERESGQIQINETDSLSLEQFKNGLKKAISRGLKLAIFNSCDGLGLAQDLADLHIPQVIVMRELVSDAIAKAFLQDFLTVFSQGESLYISVREAREKLEKLEDKYPGATWLPVIYQNPADKPLTWQDCLGSPKSFPELKFRPSPHKHFLNLMLTSGIVTVLVVILRLLGLFQSWELQSYDRLMSLRPDEEQDDRLLIVTITEEDFQLPEQKYGTVAAQSLSDLALSRLWEKLAEFQPRAIGLDIYHPHDFDPQQSNLIARLQNNDNFFIICNEEIASPPELSLERQGFSDIVKDSDGILRRHLIALQPAPASDCPTPYALSAMLAFYYLQQEGKDIQYNDQEDLQIGEVVFNRFPAPVDNKTQNIFSKFWRSRKGGYQKVDNWGYQILLNYRSYHRSPLKIAPTVSLTEVIQGQINREMVEDRIVFIGVTAPSAGDLFSTPYSNDREFHEGMPGVIAQAQMTSQILSAVLDGRPLISVWSFWGEVLWIWIWSFVGGIIVLYGRTRRLFLVLAGGIALGILYLFCWELLIQGIWVPLVPSVFALGFTCIFLSQFLAQRH